MKSHFIFASIISVYLAAGLLGCGGPQPPSGLPKLYPCSITILKDGNPEGGVLIMLAAEEGDGKWGVAGHTNASGVAVMRTGGQYDGAPAGTYKVLISKNESPDMPDVAPANWVAPITYHIDKKFSDIAATPYTLAVANKAVNEKFEVTGP